MADFEIITVKANIFFNKNDNIYRLDILIPDYNIINTEEGRERFEKYSFKDRETSIDDLKEFLETKINYGKLIYDTYGWPAGGLLQVVGDTYALFILDKRDSVYPGYITIASGLGKLGDVFNPEMTMKRKGIENIAFYNDNDRKIYVPDIISKLGNPDMDERYSGNKNLKRDLENKILKNAQRYGYTGKIELINSKLSRGEKPVSITDHLWRGFSKMEVPEISIDPLKNEIYIVGELWVNFDPEDIKKYKPFDSGGLERDIVAVEKIHLKDLADGRKVPVIIFHSDGKVEEKYTNFSMTPVARTSVQWKTGETDVEIILKTIDGYFRTHKK